jgi:hypothetical protein
MVLLAGAQVRVADMILNIVCSIALAYFILREAVDVKEAYDAGFSIIWTGVGIGLVGLLILTLLAVWL